MDRRRFLTGLGGVCAAALVKPKSILTTGPSTSVAPQAAAEVAKQATHVSVSLNQVLRVFENAKAGLDQGFSPDMTIGEFLGKTPVAKASKETKSKASSSSDNDEALKRLEIGKILAAISTPAQHLSGQIHALANKKAA